MASHRMDQVNAMIQQNLAEVFAHEIELPRDLLVTVFKVQVEPNLKTALVYLSVLPHTKTRDAIAAVVRQRKLILKELSKRIHLKFTPILEYRQDDSQEKAQEITDMLDDIR